jgi:hypothetical protein
MTLNPTPDTEKRGPRRPLARTLRQRAVPLLAVFCLLCCIVFLTAPTLRRTYRLAGSMQVKVQAFDALPELARLPDATIKDISHSITGVNAVTKDGPGGQRTIQLTATNSSRDSGLARMHMFAQQLTTALEIGAMNITDNYRAKLRKSADQLASQEQQLMHDINDFRLKNRGALPDDPNSTLSQFQKLADRLEEKQARLSLVTQHVGRLQDYKKNNLANGGRGAAPPPLLAPEDDGSKPATPVRADADPEVRDLAAQVQLIAKLIDEQLTKMGRTEQHPYVKDLRGQQAALQKKLDAARQRAAAGKPPPPGGSTLVEATTRPAEANMLAVDMQLETLQAELDTLKGEVKILTARRDEMQKQVDQVLPIRQEFEKLTSSLASTQKERAMVRTRTEDFEREFGAKGNEAKGSAIVEVTPLALTSNSTLPSFPQVPLVYMSALLIGAVIAGALALVLHRMDRALHTVRDVKAALDVPVIGAISEIRSPRQLRNQRLWRTAIRPAMVLIVVGFALGCAVLCYVRLADPSYAVASPPRGATAFFAVGGGVR